MQRGDGDITEWLIWYAQKLADAIDDAEATISTILHKSFFWQKAASVHVTERQAEVLNIFLDGYEAKITSKSWATLAKCSKDTALRDLYDLVDKHILREDVPGAKRPSYSIVYDAEDVTPYFSGVSIAYAEGVPYLHALFKGNQQVRERVLPLDAERFKNGELPLANLLSKYCTYILATHKR